MVPRPRVRSILPSCSKTFRALRIVVRLTLNSPARSVSLGRNLGARSNGLIRNQPFNAAPNLFVELYSGHCTKQ
jgi:hypothetical protein